VWATWWGVSSGISHMWVAVTEQDKRVVVFGAASTGVHVEAFWSDNGDNLFRFANSY